MNECIHAGASLRSLINLCRSAVGSFRLLVGSFVRVLRNGCGDECAEHEEEGGGFHGKCLEFSDCAFPIAETDARVTRSNGGANVCLPRDAR